MGGWGGRNGGSKLSTIADCCAHSGSVTVALGMRNRTKHAASGLCDDAEAPLLCKDYYFNLYCFH